MLGEKRIGRRGVIGGLSSECLANFTHCCGMQRCLRGARALQRARLWRAERARGARRGNFLQQTSTLQE